MLYFAKLNSDNIVEHISVVNESNSIGLDGNHSEEIGKIFCSGLASGKYVQTTISGDFRKNPASMGFLYDYERDAFISQKYFASWILDESTCKWIAPKPRPSGSNEFDYYWDELNLNWVKNELENEY